MATEVKTYLTPVFRASFPNVYVAQQFDGGGEPKFGVAAVWEPSKFSPKDKALWDAIMAALNAESQLRFKVPFDKLPANVKRGVRDGAEKADLEGYGAGKQFANLTSKMRPGIVDLAGNKIGPEHANADQFYPGVYARAKVTVYSYDNKGKGVALGLNNLQKIRDGARLDARTDAAKDFDGAEVDDSWLQGDDEAF